jgi:hypothetical protein
MFTYRDIDGMGKVGVDFKWKEIDKEGSDSWKEGKKDR